MIKIRLKRISSSRNLFYTIVVTNNYKSPQGNFIEKIGTYTSYPDKWSHKYIFIDSDKLFHWIANGAVIDKKLYSLLQPILLTRTNIYK